MKKSILAVVLLSAFALPAFADSDFNASISLGSAATPDNGSGVTVSGMSYSFLLGYQVNKNFSTEVGYTSLYGNSNVTGGVASATQTTSGAEVAGVASYPINDQFSVYGRLGYASLNTAGNLSSTSGLVYGPGLQYDINKQVGVRAGYNIYNTTGSNGDLIVNNAYASAVFNF